MKTIVKFIILVIFFSFSLASFADSKNYRECFKTYPLEHVYDPSKFCCAKHDGKLLKVFGEDDHEYGVCLFADNTYCNQHSFAYGECSKGDNQ